MVTDTLQTDAWRIAAAVADPEVPVLTIEDLGVLRAVTVDGDVVRVDITPTYSGCPAMDTIRDMSSWPSPLPVTRRSRCVSCSPPRGRRTGCRTPASRSSRSTASVSYTHLTLPTNREV